MINLLFDALSLVGSLMGSAMIVAFAVLVVGVIAGLTWEAFAFYNFGNLEGMGRGFQVGALVGLAWSLYALAHAVTVGAAFLPVLGLVGVALIVMCAVKSYIGMQPRAIPDWA